MFIFTFTNSVMGNRFPGTIFNLCTFAMLAKVLVCPLIVPKLKTEHINLTAFSKMRVDLAVQVT